jgi:uncharacterized membrane protein (UPF0127 family)
MICVKTPLPPRALFLPLLLALTTWFSAAHAQEGPQPRLPTVELTAGMHLVQAELAVTPAQQTTGMMFRRGMGANEGMLFVNEDSAMRCFWMRNTLIPLSIAFIADDGTIVNIAEMAPRSDDSHCSTKPARYALEMSQGWFSKRGLKAGLKLRGGPFGK